MSRVTNEFLDKRLDAQLNLLHKSKMEVLASIDEAEKRVDTMFSIVIGFQTFAFICTALVIVFGH